MTLQINNCFNSYINSPTVSKEALFPKKLYGKISCLLPILSPGKGKKKKKVQIATFEWSPCSITHTIKKKKILFVT